MKLHKYLQYFVISFLVLSILSMLALFLIETQQKNRVSETIISNENNIVSNQTSVLADELNSVLSDLKYLKESFLESLAENESDSTIAIGWKILSRNKRIYDQIRYLDENGQEVIRVNYSDNEAYIVENDFLQNKSNRYYFEDSVILEDNTVYISPFDLNIENGAVELPIKPMIRFATPIYDESGTNKGIIIVNYLASNILDKIIDDLPNNDGNISLLNEDGYWLYSGTPELDWGFMYPEKMDVSFKLTYSEAWDRISSGEKEFKTDNGLFISEEIVLSDKVEDETLNDLIFGKGSWLVISHINRDNPNSYYFLAKFGDITIKILKDNYYIFILILFVSIVFAYLYLRNRDSFNQIKFFSEYDDMTGILNRRAGIALLKRKLITLKNERDVLTICFIDVNGLKKVNDGLGHNFGDELLETVASSISKAIRDRDVLARLGGDEFLLVLDGIDVKISETVWKRIQKTFIEINEKGKRPYAISVSHGFIEVDGSNKKSVDELIKEADLEMYNDKEQNRGKVKIIRNRK